MTEYCGHELCFKKNKTALSASTVSTIKNGHWRDHGKVNRKCVGGYTNERVNTDERVVLKGGYRRMEKTMFQSKSLCQKHQQLMNIIMYQLDLNR